MEKVSKNNFVIRPKKERRFLMFISLIVLVAIGCFFSEGHAYFNPGNRVLMSNQEFWYSFAFVFLFLIVFLITVRRYYPSDVNWFLFSFYLVFLLIGFIALLFYPGLFDTGDLVYSLSPSLTARYCASFFIEATCFYLFLDYGPKIIRGMTTLDFVFMAVVADCLVAIFYSYVTESSLYISIFNNGPRSSYAVPQSFTTNRNVYAALLFYGLVCECYLLTRDPRWWRWVVFGFLFINQMILMSKTIFAASAFFVIAFLVFRYFHTLKTHLFRNNVVLGIFVLVLSFALIWPVTSLSRLATPRISSLYETYFDLMSGSISSSFIARIYDWEGILKELLKSPVTMLFGFGESNYQYVISYINPLISSGEIAPLDSAYIAVAAKYGFLGCILYLVFLGYLVFCLLRGLKNRRLMSIPYLMALVSFLGTGFLEGHYFLGFQSPSVILLIVVAFPIISDDYFARHQQEEDQAVMLFQKSSVGFTASPKKTKSPTDILRISYFVMTPLFAILIGCLHGFSSVFCVTKYSMVFVLISLTFVYLLLPIFLFSLRTIKENGQKGLYFLLWIFVSSWILLVLVSPLLSQTNYLAGASIAYGILIFLVLVFSSKVLPFSTFFHYSGRYLWVFFVSVGLNLLMEWLVVPFSHYLVFACAMSDVVLWFSCFSSLGCYADIRPVSEMWDSLENWLSIRELRREWRWEAREKQCKNK